MPDRLPVLHPDAGHRCRRPRPVDRLAPGPPAQEVLVVDKTDVARRRLGHRLRHRAQQLLPAGDAGADGGMRRGVGVRSRGAALPRQRLHRARPAGSGGRPGPGVRAPPAHRLPLRAARRRGRGRRAHALAVLGLARAGPHRLPARAARAVTRSTRNRCSVWRTKPAPPALGSPTGVEVTGFDFDESGAVTHRSRRARATIAVDQVVVAVGPWIASLWQMLGLPDRLDVHQPDGTVRRRPADVDLLVPAGGRGRVRSRELRHRRREDRRPVLHVDSDQPLHADDGTLITDEPWGVYFKPDRDSIQGGAQPITRGRELRRRPLPHRHRRRRSSPTCGPRRCRTASSASRARAAAYRQVRSGGVGAFTADNFPVFDYMRPQRVRRGRLQPRLQDDRGRARRSPASCRASTPRCCTRSATSASPPATCIRCRTAPTPGADRGPQGRPERLQAAPSARPAISAAAAREAAAPL